ncbi:MAG: DUF2135 domain-containing protein [Bacteroidales bacterium]|nr:DUF2135 domain-containing protein [Bacteroidales bacterium]
MKKLTLIKLLIILMTTISAQNTFRLPFLTTLSQNDKAIELAKMKISVFVVENIATTTLEMEFYNKNNRVMEGELNFPLPNGVTVSRFALDVNGEMREGVVVEKEKATQAFEAVTRQNVDPGLVEVTRGNNFKARVYPIPGNGYKKAILAFEQELQGDGTNFIYQLPLNLENTLEHFAVKVEVVMNKPIIDKSVHPRINLNFSSERNSYIAEYSANQVNLDTYIAFSMPRPEELHEVLTYRGQVSSDNYFYINLDVQKEEREKVKPSKLTILWDESASAKNRDIQKDLAILSRYLQWMGEGLLEVKCFSNTIHAVRRYTLSGGQCEELINFLKSRPMDGGTNLTQLGFNTIDASEILLFSDGISDFGKQAAYQFICPVVLVNSSGIADHNLLEYIASASNGFYVDASTLTGDEIFDRITHEQKRFIRSEYDRSQIREFYPSTSQTVMDHFSCVGIAEGSKNQLTLHFGFGNEITESRTLVVDNTQRIDHAMGERIWAQKKLKELLVGQDDKAVKEHGKKFSLVSPGTSLIVLDAVEDYVRYEITPPASLRDDYYRILAMQSKERQQSRAERLAAICSEFNEDYTWWKNVSDFRDFDFDAEKKNEKDVAEEEEFEEMLFMSVESAEYDEAPVSYRTMRTETEEEELSESIMYAADMTGSVAKEASSAIPAATVSLQQWDSDALYMSDLKATDRENLYTTYLELKKEHAENPSFYFDVATYMLLKERSEEGLRVISNLAELELENAEIMRTMGRKLAEFKFYEEALATFEEVMKSRSFEPHSYIDLGLVYADMGEYQKAIQAYYTIIEKAWDPDIIDRFPGISLIVLHELNTILAQHKEGLDYAFIDTCFIKHMPVDIRIVIDWDANDTDIDLWITDPRGEKCSYQNQDTRIGGKISNDITQGYGPEEFRLKYAIKGEYQIDANFYGSNKQTGLNNVTVRAFVYTRFGTRDEQRQVLTLQLEPGKDGSYTVGSIVFE